MSSVPSGDLWAVDLAHKHVMRSALILRDGPTCHYCGRVFSSRKGKRASFDHIWPQSLGRIDAAWNLVLACQDCNSRRGSDLTWCSCLTCSTARDRARAMVLREVAG